VLEEREGLVGEPARMALGVACHPHLACRARVGETPDHDASEIERAFSSAPAAGFFCAGEIGPVGNRNFVHGFTATLAVFAA
jgi:small ligand-binding sensory domain FIST